MMRRYGPKKDPVDPTPPMPEGATEFEERWIKADFLAVFSRIANALFNSPQQTHEYAYRCGFVAGKSKRELDQIETRKLPSFIKIL
jgi:hypothetical protein